MGLWEKGVLLIEATAKRPGGVHDEAAGVVPSAAIREEQRRFGMANWVLSRQRQAADRGGPHGNEGPDGGRKTSRRRGSRSEDGFTGKRSAEPG